MIFVNARFLTQPVTGVQRYAIEISRTLQRIDPSIRFVAPRDIIHQAIASELGVETIGRHTGHVWEQFELPAYLRKNGFPLLISLAAAAPISYARKIVTLHDLSFKHFPQALSWQFRLLYNFLIPRVLRSSLHVTTVSDFSKLDICRVYGLPAERISVVHNASSFESNEGRARLPKERIIVAVGSIQPYKNLPTLIEAFDRFNRAQQRSYVLKLVGGLDAKVFRRTAFFATVENRRDVALTGRLTDAELQSLYQSAECFVFPSLFEGFGIPPLEAMACGCPVIASNAASIPEVCGDAALYCDPHDAADIAEKLAQLVDNPSLQAELTAKGYDNIRRFSWSESGSALFNIASRFSDNHQLTSTTADA